MLVNDVKKGMRVQLRNGWYGTMADNAKGNVRMVDVEGLYREIGSVYAHDIATVRVYEEGGNGNRIEHWEPVTLSERQAKAGKLIRAAGF